MPLNLTMLASCAGEFRSVVQLIREQIKDDNGVGPRVEVEVTEVDQHWQESNIFVSEKEDATITYRPPELFPSMHP